MHIILPQRPRMRNAFFYFLWFRSILDGDDLFGLFCLSLTSEQKLCLHRRSIDFRYRPGPDQAFLPLATALTSRRVAVCWSVLQGKGVWEEKRRVDDQPGRRLVMTMTSLGGSADLARAMQARCKQTFGDLVKLVLDLSCKGTLSNWPSRAGSPCYSLGVMFILCTR
jgi:hypothetical protein